MESFSEFLTEAGPRIKRVRLRIRNGKVQRNIRVSNVKGFTLRGGKMKRMSSTERLHRRRGALRGRFKRRSKQARTLMKRQRSMRRRHAMGL